MELNKISSELVMKMGLMKKITESSLGNGFEFELIYQSLLKVMAEKESSKVLGDSTSSDETLKAIEMLIGGANYRNSISNEVINEKSKEIKLEEIKENNEIEISNEVKTLSKEEKMQQIYNSVNKYSNEYGVNPNFILGIIKAESSFNHETKSGVGAIGLMQLMPETAKELGVNPYDMNDNIKGGVKYISQKIKQYGGNKELALMAYNAGSGTMNRRGVKFTEDLYKMPLETRNYVPKVMKYYDDFKIKSI